MSNCIEIRRGQVFFSATAMNIPAFMAQVQRARETKDAPGYESEAACNDSVFWWFLSTNVFEGAGGVVVQFGRGRSTHCWRDFYATCKVINKYMRKEKMHVFLLADEGDGFDTWGNMCVAFGRNAEPFEY